MPWMTEDSVGSPQKLGPCGNEGGGTATGAVTPYAPGQTVMLQWTEVVSHQGWFRIAIAADRNAFQDPAVEVTPSGMSADASVENPPVAPVVVDGLYPHAVGAVPHTYGPYALTLPTTPCADCTIQIIQVMLDHPSNLANLADGAVNPDGFLYHHCIDISIAGGADGGASTSLDAGTRGAPDASTATEALDGGGTNAADSDARSSVPTADSGSSASGATTSSAHSPSSGCSCTTASMGAAGGGAWSAIVVGAALLGRRRGRRPERRPEPR